MTNKDLDPAPLLRRLRRQRGIKQSALAESLGVTQSTVSRWESGRLAWSEPHLGTAKRLLEAPQGLDSVIRRLVDHSALEMHLIRDRDHRLLAASASRWSVWRAERIDLLGRSLFPFASREILQAEAGLAALGWNDGGLSCLTFETGANQSDVVPIRPSLMRWERIVLEDGCAARLVTTLA